MTLDTKTWGVSPSAEALHRDTLVWDAHAGFAYEPDVDLDDLKRWHSAGVDFLSVNVGFDVPPWNGLAIEALSSYRRQIRERPEFLMLAETVEDVRRAKREGKLAIAFDLEGMDALNGDVGMVETFHRLGVRQMLFAYNRNNLAGGGCHDKDVGLTDFGGAVVGEMNRLGMIVDCSHCAFRTTMEAIEVSEDPVIFSHSNSRALRDHERNIRDEQAKACAAKGGLIGVTGVGLFIGPRGADIEDLVRHVDHFVDLVGPGHVGIGLDIVLRVSNLTSILGDKRAYWPARQYPPEGTDFIMPEAYPRLTELLLGRGYNQTDISGILGGNFFRIAEEVWK